MGYRLIGEAAMVVHFLFLVFMAVGGFLAWRWPRLIWAHLAVAAWGLTSVVTGVECPLTVAEDWGRRNAGERGLPPAGSSTTTSRGSSIPRSTRTWYASAW
ncbi:DUF2784 domain-containing protein [Streptosporangium lutulentum]